MPSPETELPIWQWQVRPLGSDGLTLIVSMHQREGFRVWTTVRLAEPLAEQVRKQRSRLGVGSEAAQP